MTRTQDRRAECPSADVSRLQASPFPRTPNPAYVLILIALAIRCWVLLDVADAPFWRSPTVDEVGHLQLAERMLNHEPPMLGAYYTAPGYAYILAGIRALGGDPFWIKYLQLAVGVFNVWLIYLLGRNYFGPRAGFFAGLLWALYPSALMHEVLLLKPTLTVCFCLLALLAISRPGGASVRRWALAGLALGAAGLLRGELVLVALLLFSCAAAVRWRGWPGAPSAAGPLAACGALLLVLAVPTIENLQRSGQLVVVAYGGGTNFYIGNNADADGSYRPLRPDRSDIVFEERDAVEMAVQRAGRPAEPLAVSSYWYGKGRDWWAQDLSGALLLTGKKILLCWSRWEGNDVLSIDLAARWVRPLRNPIVRPLLVLPLALVGVFVHRKRRDLWPLWCFLLGGTLSLSFFFVFERFRLPLAAVAVLFTGALMSSAIDALRERRYRQILQGLGLAAVAVAVLAWPSVDRNETMLHVNIGNMLLSQQMYEEALEEYRIVRRLAPASGRVLINMANAQYALGRYERALHSLAGALDFLQHEARTTGTGSMEEMRYCLEMSGTIASSLGRGEQALRMYRAALTLDPESKDLADRIERLEAAGH